VAGIRLVDWTLTEKEMEQRRKMQFQQRQPQMSEFNKTRQGSSLQMAMLGYPRRCWCHLDFSAVKERQKDASLASFLRLVLTLMIDSCSIFNSGPALERIYVFSRQ